ncbi:helix-turn-helix domain-containing protein [Natronococcus sp.]|uniref:helix-turn-helix domain-containing protein n=1 Tax=Natronococcus sp. TaxID=35747 RepID=UPI003A4E3D96
MLIGTFQLEAAAFALEETLEALPELEVGAERIAAHGTAWIMPCIWVAADDYGAADDAITNDSSVESIVETAEFEDEKLYDIRWSDDVVDRINAFIDREATILNAQATAGAWELRVRFASRDQFDRFRELLNERDYSFGLVSLTRPDETRHSVGKLTPAQREALRVAKERGYYEVPRRVSTRELAAELEMSHQNLSGLLRRGTEKLIDETLDTSARIRR